MNLLQSRILSAYIPVDVHGLATIYNITDDTDELHQKAKRATRYDLLQPCSQ